MYKKHIISHDDIIDMQPHILIRRLAGVFCGCSCYCCCCVLSFSSCRGFLRPPSPPPLPPLPPPPSPPASFHIALYHLIRCSSSFLRPVVASWFVCVSGCAPAPCPLCVPWLPPLRLPCLFWSVCSPCLLLPFLLVLMLAVSFSCLMFLACFLCFAFCSTTHPRTTMPPDYRQMCQTLFLIY